MARKELETIQSITEYKFEDNLQHFSPNDTEYFEEALKEIAYYESEFGRIKTQNQILKNYLIGIENAFKITYSSNFDETIPSIIEFIKENNLSDKYHEWKKARDYEEIPENIESEISRLENEINGEIPLNVQIYSVNRKEYYMKLKDYVNHLHKIREIMKRGRGK